jgi:hypothetical protein
MQDSIELTNVSGAPKTYTFQVVDPAGGGVAFSVPGTGVTLADGASALIAIQMTALKGGSSGHKQAVLQVSAGGKVVAQAMLYALIK